jgi:carbamoyltransferase
MTRVLGIHHSGPISSAALVIDGRVVSGVPEERFSRIKHDDAFPHEAIRFCLDHSGIALTDLDAIAIGWNPGENASLRYRRSFSERMRYPGDWLASVPNQLLSRIGNGVVHSEAVFRLAEGKRVAIHYVDHHLAHARLAQVAAGFDESVICVVDGWSEQKVTTLYRQCGGAIDAIWSKAFPHSIGGFYATMTEFLGYRPFSDEWRVMGMAAYGDAAHVPEIERLIALLPDGDYELDLSYFDFYNFDRAGSFTPKLEALLGPARRRGEPLTGRHFDVAAAAQRLFERVMTHLLNGAHAQTGCRNLCLAGGAAMNCLFNGKVTALTTFERCRVSFAPDDSGNAIGAALAVVAESGAVPAQQLSSAIGPAYSDDEIGDALERYKLRATRHGDCVDAAVALLAEGRVVGWVQGRAEFGQRALGHRSILASPLAASMKERINATVKFRESYRPYAPALPEAAVATYFEDTDGDAVRFMEKAQRFRPGVADLLPAVVHADGTGRLQAVTADEDLLLRLLTRFGERSGHPVLVNTSFNLNGEPVVLSPDDAIRTFVTSGLDALVIGSYVLVKGSL